MAFGILQANLGRGREAQDLFLHSLAECGLELGIVAEPSIEYPTAVQIG